MDIKFNLNDMSAIIVFVIGIIICCYIPFSIIKRAKEGRGLISEESQEVIAFGLMGILKLIATGALILFLAHLLANFVDYSASGGQ